MEEFNSILNEKRKNNIGSNTNESSEDVALSQILDCVDQYYQLNNKGLVTNARMSTMAEYRTQEKIKNLYVSTTHPLNNTATVPCGDFNNVHCSNTIYNYISANAINLLNSNPITPIPSLLKNFVIIGNEIQFLSSDVVFAHYHRFIRERNLLNEMNNDCKENNSIHQNNRCMNNGNNLCTRFQTIFYKTFHISFKQTPRIFRITDEQLYSLDCDGNGLAVYAVSMHAEKVRNLECSTMSVKNESLIQLLHDQNLIEYNINASNILCSGPLSALENGNLPSDMIIFFLTKIQEQEEFKSIFQKNQILLSLPDNEKNFEEGEFKIRLEEQQCIIIETGNALHVCLSQQVFTSDSTYFVAFPRHLINQEYIFTHKEIHLLYTFHSHTLPIILSRRQQSNYILPLLCPLKFKFNQLLYLISILHLVYHNKIAETDCTLTTALQVTPLFREYATRLTMNFSCINIESNSKVNAKEIVRSIVLYQ